MAYPFLVDASGRVIPANSADDTTRSRFVWDAVGVSDADLRRVLKDAIADVINQRVPRLLFHKCDSRSDVLVVRPAREPGHAVVATQAFGESLEHLPSAFISDFFQLTHAEADVALLFARGFALADIALMRDVARETVRGQLKTVRRKLSVDHPRQLISALTEAAMLCSQRLALSI
jgi:DNA-binding CsgD family transcriptional regulator